MKLQAVVFTVLSTLLLSWPGFLLSREDGAPAGATGGDFPGEGGCAQSSCHVGQVNTGPGRVSILLGGMPIGEYRYRPGEIMPVEVRIEDPNALRWGFALTARTTDGCDLAGSFAAAEPRVQVKQSDKISPCASAPLQWATHRLPKTGEIGSFLMHWTAPSEDIGRVRFAAAGNAANGDGRHTGDVVYTIEASVEADTAVVAQPSINEGGIVLATGTPVVRAATAHALVTIYGQEFARSGVAALVAALDNSGRVSTQLAGTCVEIDGERSPLLAVLPHQINLQVPHLGGLGPASVVVVRSCGTTNEVRSQPRPVDIAATVPAFFHFVNRDDGRNPIAALHGGGPRLVGAAGLLSEGVETSPAAPGETISLFGTGFGPTRPSYEAGEIPQYVNADNPLAPLATQSVRVSFGGMELPGEDIFYVGLAPCCAGLYQLVARVPESAADGDLGVRIVIDGVSSPEGPYITVARPLGEG